jgi:MinD superfamily P-loop ATPase
MRIAVASGKGGTGKTTVATNLAAVASRDGRSVAYLDCDVEEPNGHIFLKPQITRTEPIGSLTPQVDEEKCTHCGTCAGICQYGAIACLGDKVLVYPELCHACGGCGLACPADAITETFRPIGRLETGHAGPIPFVRGVLNVGEPMSPPVIKAVKAAAPHADLVIADVPPGTSCPAIESVRGTDFVLLVTEPTPFGMHDLKLAMEMVDALGLPCGVVVNQANPEGLPHDRRLAEAYSRGELASNALPKYHSIFLGLLETLAEAVSRDGKAAG